MAEMVSMTSSGDMNFDGSEWYGLPFPSLQ
jgi:hypothetical protein